VADVHGGVSQSQVPPWYEQLKSLMLQQQASIEGLRCFVEDLRQDVAKLVRAAHGIRDQLKPKVVRQHVAYYLLTQYPKAAVITVRNLLR